MTASTTVETLSQQMNVYAPLDRAADWDNVGLLVGAPDWDASHVLLTIDLTSAVLDEAIAQECSCILAYHPPIFSPLKSLTNRTEKESIILRAARAGIAIYSPHTALDAAPDGINDWLATACGPGDVRALRAHETLPTSEQCKIVTYGPEDAIDQIRFGLASVGAGQIGAYDLCSFSTEGMGTFRGDDTTNPVRGTRGQLESLPEHRLEMVCARASLALAVMALREFHPYEEPPIEIYDLRARPLRDTGEGRRVVLDQPVTAKELAARLKSALGLKYVKLATPGKLGAKFDTIGLCAGAGGSMLNDAIAQGCQCFFTGEMRHHDALSALSQQCGILLAGHTNTERGYLKVLRQRLKKDQPSIATRLARADVDPLRIL